MPKQSGEGHTAPTAASAVAEAGGGEAFPRPLSTADMDAIGPFARLVRLLGRGFYTDVIIRDGEVTTAACDDNRGLAVVVLDNLTRFAWIKENELAKLLKMKEKNLILLLQFLEEEKLLKRELIKGTQVKINDAIAEKEDGKFNVFTGSYCCLDYSQVLDVTRYRLNHMKQSIKDKLDCAAMIQEYICCICERSYSALDVVHLISNSGNTFRCENCKGELSAQIGDDSARRESRAKYANMLKRLKEQLKPIELQLHILKNLSVPDFRTVEQWTQTNMVEYVADSSSNNICETKVEIPLPNISAKLDDTESDCLAGVKVLPMWIIQKGMCSQEKDQIKDERRVGLKAKRRDGCSGGEFGASSRRT